MTDAIQTLDDSLPHRFLSEIEKALHGSYTTIPFPSRSITVIAAHPILRQKLLALIADRQNGIEISAFMADFVEDISDAYQSLANKAEGWIELIDRSLLAISAATIIPSLVLMLNQAATAGVGRASVLLLVSGVIGLFVSAGARFTIRARVNRFKGAITNLKRLSERLRRR